MDHRRRGDLPIKKLNVFKIWIVALLFFVVEVKADSSQWANQVTQALSHEQAGDVSKTMSALHALADEGNGLAQFTYAWRLKLISIQDGKSIKNACLYFESSAKLNVPVGAQEAGHCYRDKILTADKGSVLEIAESLYNKAVENGLLASICDVAHLYRYSLSDKLNETVSRCEQAAMQGALYAQEILVDIFADPKSLNNNEKAVYWLQIAAEKSAKSAYRYALTLHQSGQIKPELTRYYFESAASKGYVPAYLETSALYFNSFNQEPTQEKAEAYLAKAYLWSSAWKHRNPDSQAPEWLNLIEQNVPDSWRQTLDEKVDQHLSQFSEDT